MYQYGSHLSWRQNTSEKLIMATKNIITAHRTPRLRTSCKRISKSCCAKERETAWSKFRRQNKNICKNFEIET